MTDKNVKILNGHPLLAYSVRAACLTKGIDRVIVSTDSEEYASIAKKYGAEVPFLRPKEISQDHSTDLQNQNNLVDFLCSENSLNAKLHYIIATTLMFSNIKKITPAALNIGVNNILMPI